MRLELILQLINNIYYYQRIMYIYYIQFSVVNKCIIYILKGLSRFSFNNLRILLYTLELFVKLKWKILKPIEKICAL